MVDTPNSYIKEIASRLAERSAILHNGCLLHLEASRRLLEAGLRDSCHAGISLAMNRESMRLDAQLLKLLKQYPDMSIVPSNDYKIIRSIDPTPTTPALERHSDIDLSEMLKVVELALSS